jgi:hypothetical protein
MLCAYKFRVIAMLFSFQKQDFHLPKIWAAVSGASVAPTSEVLKAVMLVLLVLTNEVGVGVFSP